VDALLDMPRYLNLMLRRFSTGTIRIDIVDMDILMIQESMDSASDKLMLGLVVGSLVVGSSLVLRASSLTIDLGVSWIAFLGYGAAAFVGFYAIYHVVYLRFRLER